MQLKKFCSHCLLVSFTALATAPLSYANTPTPATNAVPEKTVTAPASDSRDPYETFNRHAYKLNDTLDRVIIKPIAKAYKAVLPWPVTKGISNFFGNLGDVPTTANELLQAKFRSATSDMWRIVINSTIGIGGLIDVASKIGLEKHHEDFGLTLARWGYRSSNYLVLPFFGPRTVRDSVALPVNLLYLTVYPYINDVALRNSLWAGNVISDRADALAFDNVIKEVSFDPYVFQRNAYLQHRTAQINKNTPEGNQDTYVGEY